MIVWNEKIKKSDDVIKAVINELYKIQINIDGVVENFNNGKEQGSVLKLYDKGSITFSMGLNLFI